MKMHFLFVWLLVCFLLGLSACQESPCAAGVSQCIQSLQGFSNDLVTTRDELVKFCTKWKESMSCVNNYVKDCYTAMQERVFNFLVASTRRVLEEVCQPGATQNEYIRHAPCLKNISLSEDECAPQYRRLVHLPKNLKLMKSGEEVITEICCAMENFQSCRHLYASKNCATGAVQFLRNSLDHIYSDPLQEYCEYYKDICYQVSHSPRTTIASGFLLYSALLYYLFLFQIHKR